MEKELVGLFEAAKKAADAAVDGASSSNGPEVARCIDAMKQLRSFPVTKDALVETQVGRKLRHLTKYPKGKIQTMATDLLEAWKKVVLDETMRSNKNGSNDSKSSIKTEVSKAETIKVEKVKKISNVETVKIEKKNNGESTKSGISGRSEVERKEVDTGTAEKRERGETVKVEKIYREEKKPSQAPTTLNLSKVSKCNDAVRDKFREVLCEALSKVASEVGESLIDKVNACDPFHAAVSVESVLFEKLGKSTGIQKSKYRSIMFNLKDQSNPDFRRKVVLGVIKPERLINMTPAEMASDQRQLENNKIKEKAMNECERGMPPKATTDQFKCGRCGQRKTTLPSDADQERR